MDKKTTHINAKQLNMIYYMFPWILLRQRNPYFDALKLSLLMYPFPLKSSFDTLKSVPGRKP